MARYFAAVIVSGQCVWADRFEAPSAAAARQLAEAAFRAPLPAEVIDAEPEEVRQVLRELEARAAQVRTWPYKIEVRLSRAQPRGTMQ